MNEDNQLLDIFLDFGETMLGAGGEISRVEDSISHMGISYGAKRTNVFIIPSSIELTITFADGETITRTRRISGSPGTDFNKLQSLNALSRRCAAERLPVEELRKELDSISAAKVSKKRMLIGSIMAAAAFSLFFGGNWLDAIVAGIFGSLIYFLQYHLAPIMPNKVFYLFASSLIMGTGVCHMSWLIHQINTDKTIIGVIMLLIPGMAITNAVRDTLIGDTISGITKLAYCLVWAGALAVGIMTAIFFFAR